MSEDGAWAGFVPSKSYVVKSAYVCLIERDLLLSTSVAGNSYVLKGVCLRGRMS